MKTSLVTLLALAATGTAMAQSSVTMYGIADAGIGRAKIDGDQRAHMLTSSTMNNVTSRIGVTGTEDLGGGLHAGFTFESGLNLGDGSAAANFWSRQATVSLGGAWGTVTLGRNWTPADYAYDAWDLTGLANYNIVEGMFMDAGADYSDNSALRYTTPTISGLTAHMAYVAGNDHTDLDGNKDGKHKWDLAVLYDNGPIAASFDVNKLRGNKANYAVGGKYDFGRFAVAASYTAARAMDNHGGVYVDRRGFTLGGSVNLGQVDLTVDLGRDTHGIGTKKYTNGLAEAKYHFSKRTLAYAAYLRMDGTNNYGLGLRHSF